MVSIYRQTLGGRSLAGLLVVLGSVLILCAYPAQAQRPSLSGLQQQIDAQQTQIDGQQAQIDDLTTRVEVLETGGGPGPGPNTIVVALDGSGDYTDPVAAVNSINDASAGNPYVVKIMPGLYNIGSAILQMKPYVDIEGSGQLITKIIGTTPSSFYAGVIQGASNAELRLLTVQSNGCIPTNGTCVPSAIYNEQPSVSITNVTAMASNSGGGGQTQTIVNNQSSVTMTDVVAEATNGIAIMNVDSIVRVTNMTATTGGNINATGVIWNSRSDVELTNVIATNTVGSRCINNYFSKVTMTDVIATVDSDRSGSAIYNFGSSSITMTNVTAVASNEGTSNIGIDNTGTTTVVMTNVYVTASNGVSINIGVHNENCSIVTMDNVTTTATGGDYTYGVENDNDNSAGTVQMTNVTASATGGAVRDAGVYGHATFGTLFVRITDSRISGSMYSLYAMTNTTFQVENTRLDGAATYPNNLICTDVYDFNGNPLDSQCQP